MASLCVFRSGGGLFGVASGEVREVLRGVAPHRIPLAPPAIAGLIAYRGDVLTIVSLRALLGLEESASGGNILVMQDGLANERFGLAVDSVEDVRLVRESSLEPNPDTLDARSARLFDGAVLTPNGVMVRLDTKRLAPGGMVEQDEEQRGGQ